MDRYRMPDGTIVRPSNAIKTWEEDTRWDGNNHVSVHTTDKFVHQQLYKTRKGRYWLEHRSQWQGATPHAEWISEQEATRWLLLNNSKLPEDLEGLREEVEE